MTRLILTADSSAAGGLKEAGRADLAIAIEPRLVWGPPLSDGACGVFSGKDDAKAGLPLA